MNRIGIGAVVVFLFALLSVRISVAQQLQMFTAPPLVDSFPVVRVGISVSDSGKPAQPLSTANFTVTEDGKNVTPFQLLNCAGAPAAAIAVLSDASSSMFSSTGNGNTGKYFDSYSKFLALVSAPSQLALIPFTDSIAGYFPGNGSWYRAGNTTDTNAFMLALQAFNFQGNTDLDGAVQYAVKLLASNPLQRKVIVLVTDDGVVNETFDYQLLRNNGISLFVMEIDKDTIYANNDLSQSSGGRYYSAPDSMTFVPVMTQIGKSFLAEQCLIRYVSTVACPWEAAHSVNFRVNFNNESASSVSQYELGHNTRDSVAPVILVDSSRYTSRLVKALEIFPCQSGIQFFTDSALHNFAKLRPRRALPDSASDSLVVIDSTQPATGYYITRDSAGNVRRVFVSYHPQPDTNAPQLPFAPVSGGTITQNVYEQLPWDRGIKTISLKPGSKNLVLDSVRYFSKSFARAYLRIPLRVDTSSGCLQAFDSVGNVNNACYQWNGEGGDTLPPVFTQLTNPQPLLALVGTVTERRMGDVGLRNVTLTPIVNAVAPSVKFTDKTFATITINVPDSLSNSLTEVESTDSAGNFMRDTLRYSPKPDVLAPVMSLAAPTLATRVVSATEVQAWDRGIASLALQAGATNFTAASPVFADARHATIQLTITDPTQNAAADVIATDSAGNQVSTVIFYSPSAPGSLVPLTIASPYDFGTLNVGKLASTQLILTNPNAVPVTLTKLAMAGDDSEFVLSQSLPITIAAGATVPLQFTFIPTVLGAWRATYNFSNDTMLLVTVQLLGRSVGSLLVTLDSTSLAKAGDVSQLTMHLDASPEPINLDTIAFTISWDHDLATLGALSENCAGLDTGLCNYTISSLATPHGDVSYLLVRNSKVLSPSLSLTNTLLTLPINATFVAKATSTAVTLSSLYAGSFTTVSASTGQIQVGSICADSTIRAKLDVRLEIALQNVQPNPARDHFDVTIRSSSEGDVAIDLMNILGHKVFKGSILATTGDSHLRIPFSASITSGVYVLRVRTRDGSTQSQRVVIER